MERTAEGHVDLAPADELLDLFPQQNGGLGIPDQRHVRGLPPQPGIPRPKCTFRNLAEAYEIKNTPVGQSFIRSKPTCDLVIAQSNKEPHRIAPSILNTLIHQNEFEEEHAVHVASVGTPGTIIFMAFEQPNGVALLRYLIDATHCAVAALRARREFFAYVLVRKETIQCLSHIDGKPNPHFIGEESSVIFAGWGASMLLPAASDPR